MKKNLLKGAFALSLVFIASTSFAKSNEITVYNKDRIKLSFLEENKELIPKLENNSLKDMFDVKLLSKNTSGLKIKNGSFINVGTLKRGDKKTLDKIKFEIEEKIKEKIKREGLLKTGVSVNKFLIPVSIAGVFGVFFVLVKEKKCKKFMSLALATSLLATSLGLNVDAKEKYDHEINIKSDIKLDGKNYEYTGVLYYNDTEKEGKNENKEDKTENNDKKDDKKENKKENNNKKEDKKDDKKKDNDKKENKKEDNKEDKKDNKKDDKKENKIENNDKKDNKKENNDKKDDKKNDDKNKDDFVDIEDLKLLRVINKNISKDRLDDQRVTVSEMESLKELSIFLKADGSADFSENAKDSILGKPKSLQDTDDFKFMVSRGLKSIKGLEYAKNLEKLKLNENEIKDITPLKNLKKLKYIEIQRNRITDVTALKDLKNLEFLKLYNNLITDVTPLKDLTNLTGLDLHFNVKQTKIDGKKVSSDGITDISCLKELKKLTFLDVSANRIENIDVILNFKDLKDLDFSGNRVKDYSKIYEKLVPMINKQLNEANGSCGFFGQNVNVDKKIDVTENTVKVKSPYVGIKEFGNKLKDEFESEEEINLFSNLTTTTKGVEGKFDVNTGEFSFNFSKEFLDKNNKKEVNSTFKLEFNGWQWNLNLSFNVNVEDYFSVPKEYEEFYKKAIGMEKKDKNFKSYVLTKDDMKKIKKIEKSQGDITDEFLKPLKYAENLEEFSISLTNGKRIAKDLYEVTSKPKLKKFHYISNTKDNEKIDLKIDEFKSDVLEDFRVTDSNIDNLSFLKDKKLKTLVCDNCNLRNLNDVKDINSLERLEVSNNKIFTLPDLKNLKNLNTLYINGNRISSIKNLENNTNLRALIFNNCNVSDISVLEKLPNLQRVHLDKNKLPQNYMETIKKLKVVNTLGLDKISKEDFEFLKVFAIRDYVKLDNQNIEDQGENEARSIDFKDLEINVNVKKSDIKNSKIEIENPLKDFKNNFIGQKNDFTSEKRNLNNKISFKDGKIIFILKDNEKSIKETYPIEIEDSTKIFGKYEQGALITGLVTININVVD